MWKWIERLRKPEHAWTARQLSAYLDGELSPSDRIRVQAHLADCHACSQDLDSLRWTIGLTAQMPILRAPRSFLISEAIAQPHRSHLALTYVYLRGASVAAAALLLVLMTGDYLWPHDLSPAAPVPQEMKPRALLAVEKVAEEIEPSREMPMLEVVEERVADGAVDEDAHVEGVTDKRPIGTVSVEMYAAREVQKEVQPEKEVEKQAMPAALEPLEEKEADVLPSTSGEAPTGTSDSVVAAASEAEQPAEQVSEREVQQPPEVAATPLSDVASGATVGDSVSVTESQKQTLETAGVVTTGVLTATPTKPLPSSVPHPTSTPLAPQRQAEKLVAPRPTLPPPAAATDKRVAPSPDTPSSTRSILRLIEVSLVVLIVLLVGATLVLRSQLR
jgi:anti-sigma factor RsiW